MVTVFVIGIIVALVMEEVTGVSPGGIIVPGFLALAWHDPPRLAATLAVGLAAAGIVFLMQRHVLFLYGRRRFAYSVLTGIVLKQALSLLLPALRVMPWGLLVIGLVIPGLIAENCLRQGVWKTLAAMLPAVVITRALAIAFTGWLP